MSIEYIPAATTGIAALTRVTGTSTHNRSAVAVAVDANETDSEGHVRRAPAAAQFGLLGAGDVQGFAASQVIRTEPADGATGVETTVFPSVDLDLPTLPWLITAPGGNGQPVPWICLVVVAAQDGIVLDAGNRRLIIDQPANAAAELPELTETWAWAHVQYTGEITADASGSVTGAVAAAALGDPTRSVARVVCPRALAPETRYLACVVPTWDAGRVAGLGGTPNADAALQPAWTTPAAAAITLPVFYTFTFTTGPAGDFASLASRLASSPPWSPDAPSPAATSKSRSIRRLRVAWLDQAGTARTADLPMPSVLTLPGRSGTGDSGSAAAAAWLRSNVLPTQHSAPTLSPPLYGAVQAGYARAAVAHTSDGSPAPSTGHLDGASALPTWLGQLAEDARLRVAAGWGAEVVASEHEALVTSAYAQTGEATAANAHRSRAQLAGAIGQRQLDRHLCAGRDLSTAQLLSPQASRIPLGNPRIGHQSLASVLASTHPALAAATSAAFRRIARPRGPHARYLPVTGKTPPWVPPVGVTQSMRAELRAASTVPGRILGDYTLLASPAATDRQATVHDKLRAFAPPVSFATAMLAPLFAASPDAILPDAGSLPADTAALLSDDPAVIAAYLVGLNFEVQRLLQWRNVPCDRRCTPFTGFWKPSGDIAEIASWSDTTLDTQLPRHGVLAIRATLFRRYPGAAVYAIPAVASAPHFLFDPARAVQPSLITELPPDIRLFVFDLEAQTLRGDGSPGSGYYIVFQEQNSETRFGSSRLAHAAPPAGGSHWTTADIAASTGGGTLTDSAAVALAVTENPAIVAIHASRFLANPTADQPS